MKRDQVEMLMNDLNEALEVIGKKYGCQLKTNGCTFSDIALNIKVKGSVLETSSGKSGKQVDYERNCLYYGMPKDGFGKEFVFTDGKTYKVVELSPRNTKFNVICQEVKSGKLYKFTSSQVVLALAK